MTKNLKAKHHAISTGQAWTEKSTGQTWKVYSLSENGMVRLLGPGNVHRFKSLQDETLLSEWELAS